MKLDYGIWFLLLFPEILFLIVILFMLLRSGCSP